MGLYHLKILTISYFKIMFPSVSVWLPMYVCITISLYSVWLRENWISYIFCYICQKSIKKNTVKLYVYAYIYLFIILSPLIALKSCSQRIWLYCEWIIHLESTPIQSEITVEDYFNFSCWTSYSRSSGLIPNLVWFKPHFPPTGCEEMVVLRAWTALMHYCT